MGLFDKILQKLGFSRPAEAAPAPQAAPTPQPTPAALTPIAVVDVVAQLE
ncbi:MAG: DUF3597 domain-containing protein, partial [Deltaproteobacteria bacterium]|nr:DUF3597 domain-containing protein [Deltaproteobacteria bacterium]